MSIWNKWRNPIVVFAITAMLGLSAYVSFAAASDVNDAADGGAQIGAVAKAAADFELAWFQMMGADALAATGQAPDEAQGFYDGAINLYNSSKAVLAAADREPINMALAASDQGLVAMNAAFAQTMALAANGDIVGATNNHMDGTVVLYGNVDPAVKGLAQVAQAGEADLQTRLTSGADELQVFGWITIAVAALAAGFAGWTAWTIYRREETEVATEFTSGESSEPPASWERAA